MNKKSVNDSIEQLTTNTTPPKAQNTERRLMDNNAGLGKKPDRRSNNSERRNLETVSHTSPVRRYTIDRRLRTTDRRTSTEAA